MGRPFKGIGAGRRRWPAALAGALALTVAGLAVTAGKGDRQPAPRTFSDQLADAAAVAGGAGAEAARGSSSTGTAAGAARTGAPGPSAGGGGENAGVSTSAPPGGGAPAGTGSTGSSAPGGASTTAPPAAPPTTPSTSRPGAAVSARPGWRALSPAPISGRFGHAAAWTGREMVVWGGQSEWDGPAQNDGAAYDPALGTWRRIGPAPLSGRSQALTFWTGGELLVWGGMSDEGEVLADGAAWDPATNRWRRMADSPLGPRDGAAVVWAGDTPGSAASGAPPNPGRLVVWGGLDWNTGEERNDGAVYEPAADRWVRMAGGPLSARGWPQAGWTGSRVVISGGLRSDPETGLTDGAAWDPASGRWTPVARRPVGGSCTPEEACVVVWTGSRMLLSDSRLAYDPAADRWTPLAGSPGEDEGWLDEATVWTGSRMITWGGHPNEVDEQGVAVVPAGPPGVVYDPGADRWSELEQSPLTPRAGHSAVWTGQDMLVWGGTTADVGLADGAAYRPAG